MKIVITHPNLTSVTDNDQVPVPINELSQVEQATCTGVHLADCMDYVPPNERIKLLNMAMACLRHGGELTVSGSDVVTISKRISNGQINVEQGNAALFRGRMSADTISSVIQVLKVSGLEILNAKLDGLYYSVKARRPNAEHPM